MESILNAFQKTFTISRVLFRSLYALIKIYYLQAIHADQERIVEVYQSWAKAVFRYNGYTVEVTGEPVFDGPCIYVGNHISFLDIPLIMAVSRAVFVSKKEVRNFPIFGAGAAALGTIFVDRSSLASRAKVLESLHEEVLVDKKRICIFPEGTTTIEGAPWRWGALRLAAENDIVVQPFRTIYMPLRDSAFIDDDTLLGQWWKFLGAKKRLVSIHWGSPRKITDFRKDTVEIEAWVRASFNKRRSELGIT